jgi:dienelactone hydrolase
MRLVVTFGLLLAVGTLSLPAAHTIEQLSGAMVPALWGGLDPGAYHVGYRILETSGGVVHTWYPIPSGGKRLLFRDYTGADSNRIASFLVHAGVAPLTVDSLFACTLYAVASPPLPDLPHPLVLIAQGNGQDVADQVVLCEYLASRGFVVAATPSPMLHNPMEREDQAGVFAENQAAELEVAIDAVSRSMLIDSLPIGVVGHSFGARAALLLAMRDRRIQALVSLDGGIGTSNAIEPFRRATSFRSEAPIPPILHLYESLDPFMKPDFDLLKSLHIARLILEHVDGMHHIHFTTYGFAATLFPDLAALTHANRATALSVVNVAEKTADFLEEYLYESDH